MDFKLTWLLFGISLFPFALYAVYALVNICNQSRLKPLQTSPFSEKISIVIACYNEVNHVSQRLDFFLRAENWIEGSEIIVVSGGSNDGTSTVLERYQSDPRVRVFIFEERYSKIRAVNFAVGQVKHNYIVFSDCRQAVKDGSVQALLRNFNDPTVGTVSATLMDGGSWARGILNAIALGESHRRSSHNVFGALYAQRRSCFRTIPTNLIFDDLFVVVSTIAQGYRLVQEPDAVIVDRSFVQYYRRGRILRLCKGLLLFVLRHHRLIHAMPIGEIFAFYTNKYVKLILPFSTLSIAVILFIELRFLEFNCIVVWIFLIISLLLIKGFRTLVLSCLRFNCYFIYGILLFCLGKERSLDWEKLN